MLYKYLPPPRIDVLKNLEIRFSQPQKLNDPFESLPLIDLNEKIESLKREIDSELRQLWSQTASHEKTIENKELLEETSTALKNQIDQNLNSNQVGSRFINEGLPVGILSLSKTFNNLLMWSHYCDNHSGYVIGFDEENVFFNEKTINGKTTFPRHVTYTTQRSLVGINKHNTYEKLYCEKAIDWAYEEEVRIFRILTNNIKIKNDTKNDPFPVYLFKIPKECIKRIYLGANASPQLIKDVNQCLNSHQINAEIFQSVISDESYDLLFNKCHI